MFERAKNLFQRLIRNGRPLGPHGEDDRRHWERFPIDRDTTVCIGVEGDESVVGRILDVSRGGIRILLDCHVEPGTTVRIDISPESSDSRTQVLACVVHVTQGRDGRFTLGCNFSTELSNADLAGMGATHERPDGEQRAAPRLPVAGRATYGRVDSPEAPKTAAIHNISLTGVALIVSDELAPGTLLNVVLTDSVGRKVMTMVACVVYMTPQGNNKWLIGCNFVRDLYDEDLSALIAPPALP